MSQMQNREVAHKWYSVTVQYCLVNRRCWLFPLFLWSVLVALSLYAAIDNHQAHSQQLAAESARNMFQVVELTRLWNARHGGVYVPVTEETQPNPYLDVPNRDLTLPDGKRFTLLNPAYMTRQLADTAREYGVLYHITSLKPLRPENSPNEWETKALQSFEQGAVEWQQFVEVKSGQQLHYMGMLIDNFFHISISLPNFTI